MLGSGRLDLYDKHSDPGEQVDVSQRYPKVVSKLNQRLTQRGWRRAGIIFNEYARTGDVRKFVAGFDAIQRTEFLSAALIEDVQLPKASILDLRQVKRRSSLTPEQETTIERLVKRACARERKPDGNEPRECTIRLRAGR